MMNTKILLLNSRATHDHKHTHKHICAHSFALSLSQHTHITDHRPTKNSDFQSVCFSLKSFSPFLLIHKNMIVCDWNPSGWAPSIANHFVLLTCFFLTSALSVAILFSLNFISVLIGYIFEQNDHESVNCFRRKVQQKALMTLVQKHIKQFSRETHKPCFVSVRRWSQV